MKILLIVLTAIIILFGVAACMPEPAASNTPPSVPETSIPGLPAASSPSVTTPAPEPAPTNPQEEPVSQYAEVAAFFQNSQQYIYNALHTMQGLHTLLDNPDFIKDEGNGIVLFGFESFNEETDVKNKKFKKNHNKSHYGMTISNEHAWSNSSLSDVIGSALGITYKEGSNTLYKADGSASIIEYLDGKGDASYLNSTVYYDNDMAPDQTIALSFVYSGQNKKLEALAHESFLEAQNHLKELAGVEKKLASNETTFCVAFDENFAEPTLKRHVGRVSKKWWNVSKKTADATRKTLEKEGYNTAYSFGEECAFTCKTNGIGPFTHSYVKIGKNEEGYTVEYSLFFKTE